MTGAISIRLMGLATRKLTLFAAAGFLIGGIGDLIIDLAMATDVRIV